MSDEKRREALERLGNSEPWRMVGPVVDDDGSSDFALCCPSCASTNGLHLSGARTLDAAKGKLAERVRDGTFPFTHRPESVVDSLRGAQLEIGLSCEMCEKATVLGLQFHKGMIFVRWKPVGATGDFWDIWRD